ncbi:MAG: zeta toxin family protein [Magnetococcales bacterium]|nr:zeta toxin family protein [Magnetococcales bacterium]
MQHGGHVTTDQKIDRKILIIAGPNGAGKTTFASALLPKRDECRQFVNADLIAAGLSPFAPEAETVRAGRLMLDRIHDLVRQGVSFAFETTLSGRGYAAHIADWQQRGYRVKLFFLRLPDADFAVRRVRLRVRMGGHDVAEETIRRRFVKGWRNFQEVYQPLMDAWALYDNSGPAPVLLEEKTNRV